MLLGIVSLVGFVVNACTFTTLGVVLPRMVAELDWSWTASGIGYTILGATVGLSSYLPRALLRRRGVRACVAAGTVSMALGFLCLSRTETIPVFYLGTALCGVGYQTMSIIPATHVIATVFTRRALPLGIFFAVFALGSVFGPLLATSTMAAVEGQWRLVWQRDMFGILAVGLVCAAMIGGPARLAQDARRAESEATGGEKATLQSSVYRTSTDWSFAEAWRTPQFRVLAAAYMAHMLIAVSVSSLSVPHLTQRGVGAGIAAAMLSLEQLVQTAARLLGGLLGDRIEPRYLLLTGLACLAIGPVALCFADTMPMMLVYAAATGLGYGLTALATVMLLLNYFGRTHNLEIFTCVAITGAAAALGPAVGGMLRDATGTFQSGFLLFAAIDLLILAAAVMMRPPRVRPAVPGYDVLERETPIS